MQATQPITYQPGDYVFLDARHLGWRGVLLRQDDHTAKIATLDEHNRICEYHLNKL